MNNKLVYICHPHNETPEMSAKDIMKSVRSYQKIIASNGDIPVTPHYMFKGVFEKGVEQIKIMDARFTTMLRCDSIAVCGTTLSTGMSSELAIWFSNKHTTNKNVIIIQDTDYPSNREEETAIDINSLIGYFKTDKADDAKND